MPPRLAALLSAAASAAAAGSGRRDGLCPGSEPFVDGNVAPLCAGRFPEEGSAALPRWVVHFYGRNCFHCREAAEAVRGAAELAAEGSQGRSPLFGAVDCHEPVNRELCKEHGAWKLPKLKALGSGAGYRGALRPEELQAWAASETRTEPIGANAGVQPLCPAFELYDEPRIAREFLRAHNVYRCTAGLRLLVWDQKAFSTARRWAARAPVDRLGHSPEEERKGPHGAVYGENVAIGDWLQPGLVVSRWHSEIRSTTGGRGGATAIGRSGLGHYTQLVWRRTRRVGQTCCGARHPSARCSLGQHRRVAVCHYDPAGNERGKHLTQVAPPLPGFSGLEGEERCGGRVEAFDV